MPRSQSAGIRPLHHSHVGGVFETETEIVRLLDDLGPDVIGVGPDTGHLRWAGIDPATFIARYADRIGGIHIKDCFPDFLDGRLDPADGRSYHELTDTKRLWAEPGLGVVDFDAVLAALPADYDGDLMIEIDEPSVESRYESHRMAFEWAQHGLALVTGCGRSALALLQDANGVAEGVPNAHVDAVEVVRGLLGEVGDAALSEGVVEGADVVGDEDQAAQRTLGDQLAQLLGRPLVVERTARFLE